MSRRLFYFVRHGESLMNKQALRQGAEGALSDLGRSQATETGERLKNIPFSTIIASPYERTKETAGIINGLRKKPLPIEYSDLLQERRNPTEIIGKSMRDYEVIKIVDQIDKSYHDDNFRFSDEENFIDLKNRAKKLLEYLETKKGKFILCVTHGIFLRMVVAYVLYGDDLNASLYNKMSFFNATNNASITVCEYVKPWFKNGTWDLVVWDDHPHDKYQRGRPI